MSPAEVRTPGGNQANADQITANTSIVSAFDQQGKSMANATAEAATSAITILRHPQCVMAKTWNADGSIKQYDDGKYFYLETAEVGNLEELSGLLRRLHRDRHACVIRGRYVGDTVTRQRDPEFRPGQVRRMKEYFDDQPLNAVMLDIDKFEPLGSDPNDDPAGAIDEFILSALPEPFRDAGYHWQLSNSAGHPSKADGKLRAHLWFWLETPYSSAELKTWAKATALPVDHALFQQVQIHYTASPVMGVGMVDPLSVRSGFVPGPPVCLHLTDEQRRAAADAAGGGRDARGGRLREIAAKDPVAQALAAKNLILRAFKDGFDIECPFADGHTPGTGGPTSTQYYLPNTGGFVLGHFKCMHASCADRTRGDYLARLGLTEVASNDFEAGDVKSAGDILNIIRENGTVGLTAAELRKTVLTELAGAYLMASEEDDILRALKEVTGTGIGAMRTDLGHLRKSARKDGQAQVSPDLPVSTARALVDEHFSQGDETTIRRWGEEFFVWLNTRYVNVTTEEVRAKIYSLFDDHRVTLEGRGPVDNVLDAVKAHVIVPSTIAMPAWLDGDPPVPVEEIVAVRNGLLHLPSRTLLPHTPRFFSLNAVEVAYLPEAQQPVRWNQFLVEAFPDDAESIQALQEWFGYLLTLDTSQQKALLCIGPQRCGKGTIARVLRALLGEHGVSGPTLGQLGGQFGLQELIGKPLAVISDVRVSGHADVQAIGEHLLRITGEDTVSVSRKNLEVWVGKLPTRFLLLTNVMPGIIDAGGALGSRFVVLNFTQSFFGKEDTNLFAKLLEELPGILNWALDGLDALRQRNAFTQPSSGQGAVDDLIRRTTPIKGFIEDVLTFDRADSWVSKDSLYELYLEWCERAGMKFSSAKPAFFSELYSNCGGRAKDFRTRHAALPGRVQAVIGVGVNDESAGFDKFEWSVVRGYADA